MCARFACHRWVVNQVLCTWRFLNFEVAFGGSASLFFLTRWICVIRTRASGSVSLAFRFAAFFLALALLYLLVASLIRLAVSNLNRILAEGVLRREVTVGVLSSLI